MNATATTAKKYKLTIKFTSGTFQGMTIDDYRNTPMEVGKVVKPHKWLGPGYVVLACEQVGQ
jgi:hypothetical protein